MFLSQEPLGCANGHANGAAVVEPLGNYLQGKMWWVVGQQEGKARETGKSKEEKVKKWNKMKMSGKSKSSCRTETAVRESVWERRSSKGNSKAGKKKKRQKQVRNLGLTPKLSQRNSGCPWPQEPPAHPSQGWRELSVKDAAARPIQATPAVPIPSTNLAPGSQWNNLSTITASFDGHRARFLMCGTSGTPWFYGFVLFKIWKMLANYWGRFPCSAAKIITAWPRQGKHREASKHTLWVQGISGKHFYFNCWSVLRIYEVVGKLHECVCYGKWLKITYYFITVKMLLTDKAEYG